jgi:hypothetical protein
MGQSIALAEVVERLHASRAEIATRYERSVHESVSAYRSVPLAATGGKLVDLYARLVASRAAGAPLDLAAIGELDALSALRAAQGIGVGDLFAGVLIFISCAREAVFRRTADSDLRAMCERWCDVETSAAVMVAFLFDQHGTRVAAQSTDRG